VPVTSEEGERPNRRKLLVVHLRVTPGSSRDQVVEFRDGVLRVKVVAPPEAGKANAAVIALLSRHLGVPRRQLRIVRGAASRDKVVEVEGLGQEDLLSRLAERE